MAQIEFALQLFTSAVNDSTLSPATGAEDVIADDISDRSISLSHVIETVVYYMIGSFGLLGNLFVVVVLVGYIQTKGTYTNVYLVNQSLLDAIAALMVMLQWGLAYDYQQPLYGVTGDIYCRVWVTKMPIWGACISSTYNLVALTLERYLAVVHPILHRTLYTGPRVAATLVFVWLSGVIYQLLLKAPSSYIRDGRCYPMQSWPSEGVQRFVGVLFILLQFFIPLAFIFFSYMRMYRVLNVKVGADPPGGSSLNAKPVSAARARAKRNIFKTLVVVSVCFTFCWVWGQIYFLLFNLRVIPVLDYASTTNQVLAISTYLNCMVNPIIYTIYYEQFKRGARRLLQSAWRCSRAPPEEPITIDSLQITGKKRRISENA